MVNEQLCLIVKRPCKINYLYGITYKKIIKQIAVISDITLDELDNARQEVRELIKLIPEEAKEYVLNDQEAEELANAYLKEGAITKKFHEDALHIAIATINKVDVLVSWNFKHIVNLDRIKKYNGVNLKHGYTILEIRNPREILNIK